MKSSAQHLKLIWNSGHRVGAPSHRLHGNAYDPAYAMLEEVRQRDPQEAKRMMRQMLRDHARVVKGGAPRRRTRRSWHQPDLFGECLPPVMALAPSAPENIIPWRGPVLLERDSEPCPRCGHALAERSRVGSCTYYSCATPGCPNTKAVFLLTSGIGDD
jgi:hypothetical protein